MARRQRARERAVRVWDRLVIWALIVALAAGTPAGPALATDQEGRWSVASLPEPRSGMQTTTVGDVALFFGGSSVGPPSNVVDVYDHAARHWTTATLSVGRTGPSTATVGTKILVAGGWDSTGAASRVVDVYDTATGQWSVAYLARPWGGGEVVTVGEKVLFPGPETVDLFDARTGQAATVSLAQPRSGVLKLVVGTRVLLAGGTIGKTPSPMVDVYDSATDTWTTTSLPRAGTGMQAAVVGHRVLFAGSEVDEQPTDFVDVYDAVAGTWATARLSLARRGFALAVVGNVALFAGGSTSRYDGVTGAWSTARLSERRRVAAAVAGTRAVFATTTTCREKTCARTVDVYDSRTGAWSTTELQAPELFAPGWIDHDIRIGGTIVGVGSRLLFAGGSTIARFGGGQQYAATFSTTSLRIYDTETGAWSEETLANHVYAPVTGVSGTLVALAGRHTGKRTLGMSNPPQAETVSAVVNLYDGATGEWITGQLSEARRELGVAVLGNTAIFAGGTIRNSEDSVSNQLEVYDGVTGQWSTTTFPGTFPNAGGLSLRPVGTRALFHGRFTIDTLDIYDVVTREWTTGALSPGRAGVGIAVVGDQAVFAGGHDYADSASTAAVDVYDSRTGAWSAARLSEAREDVGVAVVGTRAILAGGKVRRQGQPDQDSDTVDIVDTATGEWSTTALPSVRGAPTLSATAGTRAFFMRKDKGDVYDTATGAWATLASVPDFVERYGVRVLSVGTAVILVGQPEIAVYESATGQWTRTRLSEGRDDAEIAVVGPEVIFAGGRGGRAPAGYLATADVYDSRTGALRTVPLSEPRTEQAVAVLGSRAIFAGGSLPDSAYAPSDQVDIYDAATGTWTTARLSVPRSRINAVGLRSTALFVGGSGGDARRRMASDRVDIFDLGAGQGG